jgi:hypothetical protein
MAYPARTTFDLSLAEPTAENCLVTPSWTPSNNMFPTENVMLYAKANLPKTAGSKERMINNSANSAIACPVTVITNTTTALSARDDSEFSSTILWLRCENVHIYSISEQIYTILFPSDSIGSSFLA